MGIHEFDAFYSRAHEYYQRPMVKQEEINEKNQLEKDKQAI